MHNKLQSSENLKNKKKNLNIEDEIPKKFKENIEIPFIKPYLIPENDFLVYSLNKNIEFNKKIYFLK